MAISLFLTPLYRLNHIFLLQDYLVTQYSFFPLFSSYIYRLCNDIESIKYTTLNVLKDFENDGVVYLELRTTPRHISSQGISKRAYVETVLSCIHEFKSATMKTYLILSVDRRNTAMEAREVVDLAIEYRDQGIIGVDLCGDPNKGDVSIYKDAFAKAKEHGLGLTLHFAETPASATDQELDTLLSYNPDRIGHVIHVPNDVKEEIAKRKLGLELCLSCNILAKMTSGGFPDHHFGYWRNKGCPISLCVSLICYLGHY
jgi:adenosine deaminase